MKKYLLFGLIYFSLIVLITGCSLFNRVKFGEPATTQDCPPGTNQGTINNPMLNTVDYAEADDVSIQLSRVEKNEIDDETSEINLYMHPVDGKGNYISGVTLREDYWCEVVDSTLNKVSNIKNYNLEEYTESNSGPAAIALILDQSGSMGAARVRAMQEQVAIFLRDHVSAQDEVYLVKYDNNIVEEAYPGKITTANYADFTKTFVSGFNGMGGGTALYDAIGRGIEKLRYSGKQNKVVIALTDGLENSSTSFTSGKQLSKMARQYGITLNTIGYGDNIDKVLLADDIAASTGGVYSQICRSADFQICFTDILNRYRNYYKLSYRTKNYYGEHKVYVKLCLQDKNIETAAANYYDVPLATDSLIVVRNILFDYNSAKINRSESKEAIDMIELMLRKYPDMEIEVYGHTDSIGSDKFNYDLSDKRSKAVVTELMDRGISSSRLDYKGYGEERPVADNGTSEGRQKNRRVEFRIMNLNELKMQVASKPKYKTPEQSTVYTRKI